MRNLLDAALDYAELGFAVFPVAEDCRTPLVKSEVKGQGGVHMASRDPARLAGMFARPCNLAIACGAPSGVLVIDIDVKSGKDGLRSARLLGLNPTVRAATPSGGEHWYFRQPARDVRNRVNFRDGLDVRTTGGSAAAPPSFKPSGPYRWLTAPWAADLTDLPAEVLEIIDPPLPPARAVPPGADHRYGAAALFGESRRVAQTKSGSRNQALYVAACQIGGLVAAGLVRREAAEATLEDAAKECGLMAEDGVHAVRVTIQSGLRRGGERPREVSHISPQLRALQARRTMP